MAKNYYGKVATYPSGSPSAILQLPDHATLRLQTIKGQKWLDDPDNRDFRYMAGERSFTARKETSKAGKDYWYAYRRVEGKLRKRYIGKAKEITSKRLSEIALALDTPPEPRQRVPKPVDVTHELSVTKAEVKRLQALVEELQRELGNVSSELEAERGKLPA